VPAYSESPYLRECLDSLKSQSVPVDVLIVTSTPNQFIKLSALQYKIPLLINPVGGTIAKDWNFALKQGSHNLLVLAHQDDIYHSDFAKRALSFFASNEKCAIAFTDSNELTNNQVTVNNLRELVKKFLRKLAFFGFKQTIHSNFHFRLLLGLGCSISCPSVIFNRAVIPNFCFSDEFSVNLDWDAWSRLGKSGVSFGYIRGDLLTHRIHAGAETQLAIADQRRAREDGIIFRRYWSPVVANLLLKIYKLGY
jgi:glycosyltransferase involved in cell wall biosynthesis